MSVSAAMPVARDEGAEGGNAATLVLTVGALDAGSTRLLRHHLARVEKPGGSLVVDLRQMDGAHELTLFALLAEKAREAALSTGTVIAVGPSLRLAHLLRSVAVSVTRDLPVLTGLAAVEIVTIGRLLGRSPAS